MEERLNKLLSALGVCSRREEDRLIEAGEVLVDGVPAVMGQKVRMDQEIVVHGKKVGQHLTSPQADGGQQMKKPRPVLLAVNKPRGVVCTASDKDRAPNIIDMIQYPLRVYYVGRLDKDSEGLVLMTNQGDLVNKIMRSGNAHEKEYLVTVDRPVTEEFVKRLAGGVRLAELDRVTLPCLAEKTGERSLRIVLTQGLNRQIRRMCEACGYHVRTLRRVRVMNIRLGNLKSGGYRLVEGEEYREFLRLLENSTNLTYRQKQALESHDQWDGE